MALEELTPKIEDLDNANARGHWVHRADDIQPVVERVLAAVEENRLWYGDIGKQFAVKAKWVYLISYSLYNVYVHIQDSAQSKPLLDFLFLNLYLS